MKRYYHKKYLEYKTIEIKCIEKSENWIKSNAKYPDTYRKISSTDFDQSWMTEVKSLIIKFNRKVSNSERLSIVLKYQLQDSGQQLVSIYSKFIYDKDYQLLGMYSSFTDSTVNVTNTYKMDWNALFGK